MCTLHFDIGKAETLIFGEGGVGKEVQSPRLKVEIDGTCTLGVPRLPGTNQF